MNQPSHQSLRSVAWGSWYGVLGMGLGSGLARKAPGTVGSLMAVILMFGIVQLPETAQWIWLIMASVIGVVVCQKSADALGVHDHSAIVWDEFSGMWWVLLFMPLSLEGWLTGFVLFRFFDIIKPWPIRWLDQHVSGGVGIMLDDWVAACFAIATGLVIAQLLYA